MSPKLLITSTTGGRLCVWTDSPLSAGAQTYRTWLAFQNKHGNPVRDQWVVTLLVGLLGGLTAWALAMCFHSVGHYRVHLDDTIVQSGDMLKAWAVGVGFRWAPAGARSRAPGPGHCPARFWE